MKAGQLEECKKATNWCARGFFVTKLSSTASDVRVRLVSDFRGVNKILRRPGYPMDGSSLILRRLNPDEGFFATIDLSSGYHQVALDRTNGRQATGTTDTLQEEEHEIEP